ncbi:hypothetical protein [Microterricola viridarii]|uniref:Uncharacterized protein n=1 Tax=Microterricola viridarii TaxID=412690 RepID=A0A120I1B6_9MICO|nr:hypothetical protein [Microterricola viridarii]AMB59837.1 hypothetical protein AWU67_14315 [Microterricola viridarii]
MGDTGAQGGVSRVALAWALQGAEAARTATEARLRGIRSVLAALEPEAASGLPGVVPGWHSPAAAVYAEQLRGLHAELAGILASVHAAEASAWRELAGWQGECERLGGLLRAAGSAGG